LLAECSVTYAVSVETLFRWGGNCLPDFARNLFRKWCTN